MIFGGILYEKDHPRPVSRLPFGFHQHRRAGGSRLAAAGPAGALGRVLRHYAAGKRRHHRLSRRALPSRRLSDPEEAAALLARLFAGKGLPTVRQGAAPYTDIAGRWSQSAIQTLWAAGILDEGTQFRPAAAISRADIARYIAYLTDLTEQPEEEPLPEEPAEPPVEELPTEEPTPDEELPAEEPAPDEEQTPTEEPAPDEEQPTEEPAPDEEQTPVEEPAPDEEQPTEEPTPDEEQPTEEPTPDQEQTPTEEPPAEEPAPEEEPDDGPDTLDEVRARLAAGAPAAFPDLPAGEVAACVQYLYERGIITGDNTGLYHPATR